MVKVNIALKISCVKLRLVFPMYITSGLHALNVIYQFIVQSLGHLVLNALDSCVSSANFVIAQLTPFWR